MLPGSQASITAQLALWALSINHQRSGKRIRQRGGNGRNWPALAQFQGQKHLQSVRGVSLGPQDSMERPELGAASESSRFLPERDLISLKKRGQTFKSSNPSIVEYSGLF